MRRLLPLVLAFACGGPKHPPENAQRIAAPGEPCYQPPHPWDDPPAGLATNTSNLPQCPEHNDLVLRPSDRGMPIHPYDGGMFVQWHLDGGLEWLVTPTDARTPPQTPRGPVAPAGSTPR
ncbi:MAG: hypothetical protein JWO36_408 [Myxococcales bacterium]|nr:hypothetical protein [Myxococcales bacterium]